MSANQGKSDLRWAIVRFKRQMDKVEDFVRVYGVKTRVDAMMRASRMIRGGLLVTDIKGIDLHRTSLVAR